MTGVALSALMALPGAAQAAPAGPEVCWGGGQPDAVRAALGAIEARAATLPAGAPHAGRALLDVARCREALGRVEGAIAGYRRVTSIAGVDPADSATALARLTALEAQLYGRLEVECSDDATLTMGASRWRCPTEIRLRAGRHTITADGPGRQQLSREVEVAAGETAALEFEFDDPFSADDLLVPTFAVFAGGLFVAFGAAYAARDEIAAGEELPSGPATVGAAGLIASGVGLAAFTGALVWSIAAGDDDDAPSAWLAPSPAGLTVGGAW